MCSAGIIINDIEVFQHEQLQVDLPFFSKIRVRWCQLNLNTMVIKFDVSLLKNMGEPLKFFSHVSYHIFNIILSNAYFLYQRSFS